MDLLFARYLPDEAPPADPRVASATEAEILGRAAVGALREGQWEEAITNFDRAANQAEQIGRVDLAFEWSQRSATIRFHQKQYAEAAERYRNLALQHLNHPQASEVHRLGVFALGQLAREDAQAWEAYEAALRRHLRTWSRGEASDQVRQWLGQLLASRGDHQETVAVLQLVPADSPHHRKVLRQLLNSVNDHLTTLEDADERQRFATEVIEVLESDLTGFAATDGPGNLDNRESWSDGMRWVAWAVAQLRASYLPGRTARSRQLLEDLLQYPAQGPHLGNSSEAAGRGRLRSRTRLASGSNAAGIDQRTHGKRPARGRRTAGPVGPTIADRSAAPCRADWLIN